MLAAVLASEKETELGFFFKSDMVRSAACFSAQVVPCAGAAAVGAVEPCPPPPPSPSLPNRDCSSLLPPDPPAGLDGFGLLRPIVGGGSGGRLFPFPLPLIPSPGTDTPAAPSRFKAPWFRNPPPPPPPPPLALGLGVVGEALFCRGGSRGGRLGGGGFAAAAAPTVERV